VRQLAEKYRKKKKICIVYIDKVYDSVERVLKWALMRKGVPKTYINVVEDMYE